jgi:uncharacterized protein
MEATPVTLPAQGPARIAVVADTHSEPNTRGLEHLAAQEPHLIFLCGDIGQLSVIERLTEIAPVHAVRGNIDDASSGLPEVRLLGLERDGRRVLTVFMTHIAVYGPRIRSDVAKQARAAGASLIVCGHSHVPFITQQQGLTLFNPGSIGPKRPGLPILFGMLEISTKVDLFHVDAETGQRWLPP